MAGSSPAMTSFSVVRGESFYFFAPSVGAELPPPLYCAL